MNTATTLPSLDRVRKERSERRLKYYFEHVVWPVAEPATRFVDGYHIGAICEHLEAVFAGQIRNLLINIPPRHTKSLLCSVAFPTWVWTRKPEERFLTASYALDLSIEHAVLSRRVLDSPTYQRYWGDTIKLQTDQNVKAHYENTLRGYRIATATNATGTGRGGDILLTDDPHNLKTIDSDTERQSVIDWYRKVWSTRFNDPKTGRRIVIMQRGHQADLAAYLLDLGTYEHLNLPTEYIPTTHVTCIGWRDPRTKAGELLAPDRFGPKEVEEAKVNLTATVFATQHQQQPAPLDGTMFKRAKLKVITEDELPAGETFLEARGWDFAATEEKPGTDPDYTAGVKMRRYASGKVVVMHVVHGRFGPAEGDDVLVNTARADGRLCRQREEQEGGSAGKKIIAAHVLKLAGLDYKGEYSTGSKVTRATPFSRQVDAGNVYLLEGPWNQKYINELLLFPNGTHDDQVDGSSTSFNEVALGPPRQAKVGQKVGGV